ncbi:hypothetical protein BHM03_00047411 [Ensete ventricosum]|nr:hypothetical protein BHM03_00047411 [Ensete ventricosum]
MAWLPSRGCRLRPGPLQGVATRRHGRLRPALSPVRRRRRSQGWPPLDRVATGRKGQPQPTQGQRRLQWNPRCHGGRLRCMVMRRSDETDDDEINNHRAWRCANAYIDPIVSD